MCLAVPLKITDIMGREALGEVEGVKRKLRIDFVDGVKIGDYVMVHAGFAIQIIDEKSAAENLAAIKEVTDALESI